MLAILNSLNAHNLPIFQPILMILVSTFMVYRALSDKLYLLLGLLSPLNTYSQKEHDVKTTAHQRRYNVMTSPRRCFKVVCLLGRV